MGIRSLSNVPGFVPLLAFLNNFLFSPRRSRSIVAALTLYNFSLSLTGMLISPRDSKIGTVSFIYPTSSLCKGKVVLLEEVSSWNEENFAYYYTCKDKKMHTDLELPENKDIDYRLSRYIKISVDNFQVIWTFANRKVQVHIGGFSYTQFDINKFYVNVL